MKVDEEDIRPIKQRMERTSGQWVLIIALGVFFGSVAASVVENVAGYYSAKYQFGVLRASFQNGQLRIEGQ